MFQQITEATALNFVEEAALDGGRAARAARSFLGAWSWEVLSSQGYALAGGHAASQEDARERALAAAAAV